jgi:catechol 2,3-dioxygenase-like lactoylglutathione lyase family enzyme
LPGRFVGPAKALAIGTEVEPNPEQVKTRSAGSELIKLPSHWQETDPLRLSLCPQQSVTCRRRGRFAMIHHASFGSNDLDRARAFYDPVMHELGLRLIKQSDRTLAYGLTEVLFSLERPSDGGTASAGNGAHIAFHAGHRSTVDACYRAGTASGGKGDGPPDIREQYDTHYYAAFLRDPDGNKIEIVTFAAN